MKNCRYCGANNSNSNSTCEVCGASLNVQSNGAQPDARVTVAPAKDDTTLWLVLNIFCALCCCQVLGIIGAVFAGIAKTSYRQGNIADAENKLKTSRTLFTVGVIVGFTLSVIYLLFRMMTGTLAN